MQGIARAMPLVSDEPLASPTFAIVNDYALKTGGTLTHVDLYRLETWAAFLEIDGQGLLDNLDKNSFLFIEWAERYPQLLAQMDWTIAVKELEDDARELTISKK